jgi:hypothetical protein
VLAQLTRLLRTIEARFGAELPIGERDRFSALAQQSAAALVGVARVRATDISDCVEPLLDAALAIGARVPGAASSCLRAVRESLGVQSARQGLQARFAGEPLGPKLRTLYDRVLSDAGAQPVLIAVLAVYAELGTAPADMLEAMLKELLANAEAASDPLSSDAATTTRRGAIRRLLARTAQTAEARASIIGQLLDKPFGDNDALDFIRAMPSPRGPTIVLALGGRIAREPLRTGLLVSGFDSELSADTRNSPQYKEFTDALWPAVRAELVRRISGLLSAAAAADARDDLKRLAQSRLWKQFLSAAYECLNANAAQSAERDFVVGLLFEQLKILHPGRYNEAVPAGPPEDFKKALAALKPKLTEDGYSVG